jgi:hypothetical protein
MAKYLADGFEYDLIHEKCELKNADPETQIKKVQTAKMAEIQVRAEDSVL